MLALVFSSSSLMSQKHYVYLIPGFFGFADLGGITYFHHVRNLIVSEFSAAGIEVEIHEVKTLPTASIRKRAGRLLQTIGETALDDDAPIHLIGHSTGGLDARLLTSPNVSLNLNSPFVIETFVRRIQSVVTVATPHYGTPLAKFLSSILGEKLLYMMSMATIYTMQFGKVPLAIMIAIGELVTKVDDYFGLEDSVLDELYEKLFDDFDQERQDTIHAFLNEIKNDQSLVGQLTPGGIDLFNASCQDRDSIRYGSVIMKAREPGLDAVIDIGFDPYRQSSHLIYRFLKWVSTDEESQYPELSFLREAELKRAYGEVPTALDSDGVVPTLSQIWGKLIHAGEGDHLDVCGHFDDAEHDPPHYDWLATGTSFDQLGFKKLWKDVAMFILSPES